MKKCDFYCCCSEEMSQNALTGKPTAFPLPVIFPRVQDDGREVVLVYPKGLFSAQLGKGSQGSLGVLQSCSNIFGEEKEGMGGRGGREEQAPTHGLGEPLPEYTGEEPEVWKGCATHQHLGLLCPMPARLCTGGEARARFPSQCLPWRGNLMQFGEFDYLRSLRLAGMIYECFSEIHFDTNTAKDI